MGEFLVCLLRCLSSLLARRPQKAHNGESRRVSCRRHESHRVSRRVSRRRKDAENTAEHPPAEPAANPAQYPWRVFRETRQRCPPTVRSTDHPWIALPAPIVSSVPGVVLSCASFEAASMATTRNILLSASSCSALSIKAKQARANVRNAGKCFAPKIARGCHLAAASAICPCSIRTDGIRPQQTAPSAASCDHLVPCHGSAMPKKEFVRPRPKYGKAWRVGGRRRYKA